MCRLCQWIEAKLFSDGPDAETFGRRLWTKASNLQFARTHDKDVLDRDPDLDALNEADERRRTDPEAALPLLRQLAQGGSAWSAMLLGYTYQSGDGVAPDPDAAEHWYRLAIEGGCRQAQLRLGRMFEDRGDLAAAERICAVGVAERWAPAMCDLARLRLRQAQTPARMKEVRRLLEQAAAQDDLELADVSLQLAGAWAVRLVENTTELPVTVAHDANAYSARKQGRYPSEECALTICRQRTGSPSWPRRKQE